MRYFKSSTISCYLLLMALLISLVACSSLPKKLASDSSVVHHVVLVWLKDADNKAQWIAQIQQDTYALKGTGGLQTVHVGTAIASDRKIVDDSFDLGVHMTFANKADMNAYLSHPAHVAFVKSIQPRLKKLLVYDF